MSNEHVMMPLFPMALYISKIKEMPEVIDEINNTEFNRISADDGFISKNKQILALKEFELVKKEIERHISIYTKDELKVDSRIDFKITNSWIMKHIKGDHSQSHLHVNSIFSGIVYFQTPVNSGDLVFEKSSNYTNLFPPAVDVPVRERNIFNSKTWTFTPEKNQIFIFPSHLSHLVTESNTDELRYCISFNLFPVGTLGLEHSELISVLELK